MKVNQLKGGVILNYVITCLYAIIGLLYTPYMLRQLGQSEYGLFTLTASVIAHLSILDLGFGDALVRYTAKYRAEKRTDEQYYLFGMFVVIYSIIALLAFVVGIVICSNIQTLFGKTMSDVEIDRARAMLLCLTFSVTVSFLFQIFSAII